MGVLLRLAFGAVQASSVKMGAQVPKASMQIHHPNSLHSRHLAKQKLLGKKGTSTGPNYLTQPTSAYLLNSLKAG
jgi:hypothetical protein